jgi:uncharacterized protein (TIGR01244 family)
MFRTLDEKVMVSPQITTADIAEAKAQGVTLIVNNRPGAEIEAAARAAGMDYLAIPVGQGGLGQPQLDAMAAALENAGGPVLAYCRSGTRSTLLWSLARAKLGDSPATLHEKANAAGYNLAPVAALVDMLAAGERQVRRVRA